MERKKRGNLTQLNIYVDDEFLKILQDYRFENRFNTMSDAIKDLIRKGLKK